MKMKFGIKEVVATGIGTALFVALTEVQIPLGFIPNTALQPVSYTHLDVYKRQE